MLGGNVKCPGTFLKVQKLSGVAIVPSPFESF
jgi:hypothetical protein